MKTLGQLLVERRKARGLEQKQLAALINKADFGHLPELPRTGSRLAARLSARPAC